MKIALVGLGYWGPNLLRTFNSLGVLVAAFDLDKRKIEKFSKDPVYKGIYFGTDWTKCLDQEDINAIAIATPPNTHYEIAMEAIKHNKHLFIEKPMTLHVGEAKTIILEAEKKNLTVMVGHIFLYSPEIIKLKELISSEEFGSIQYIYTKRLNLGKLQRPANVIEDLAPHDISILNYLLDRACEKAQVVAKAHVLDTEDVAFVNLKYGNILCNLHLSWLDPLKIRDTIVVGTKQMVTCDSVNKCIHLYNKNVSIEKIEENVADYADHLLSYKYGDEIIPYIPTTEPMKIECKEFIDCINSNREPLADGKLGANVVKVMSALHQSLINNGVWVIL